MQEKLYLSKYFLSVYDYDTEDLITVVDNAPELAAYFGLSYGVAWSTVSRLFHCKQKYFRVKINGLKCKIKLHFEEV